MGRDVAPAAAGGCCGARAGQWSPSHPVSAPFLPMRPPLPPQNFLLLLQPSDRRRLHPKPPLPPQTRYPLQRMTVVVPRVAVKAELLMGVGVGVGRVVYVVFVKKASHASSGPGGSGPGPPGSVCPSSKCLPPFVTQLSNIGMNQVTLKGRSISQTPDSLSGPHHQKLDLGCWVVPGGLL